MESDIASLNLKSGPPLSAMKERPPMVNSTVITDPSGPLGVSAAERSTLTMLLSENSEV